MESAARRGGGVWEGMYRLIMRRTPIYVTFVVVGAFVGERAVDRGIRSLWDHINVGIEVEISKDYVNHKALIQKTIEQSQKKTNDKRYEDIPVLGQRQSEE